MTEKKPYTPPQIFQVELNQEQAILAVCSTSATTVSNAGPGRGTTCRSGGTGASNCRRSTSSGGNSSSPAS
jgi:hypothetical protein